MFSFLSSVPQYLLFLTHANGIFKTVFHYMHCILPMTGMILIFSTSNSLLVNWSVKQHIFKYLNFQRHLRTISIQEPGSQKTTRLLELTLGAPASKDDI